MRRRYKAKSWTGLAILVCFLMIHGFANAQCLNLKPSFTYAPIIASNGRSTLKISAQAGCFWEVVRQPIWMEIVSSNRGYGTGSVVFRALPDKADAPSPEFIRLLVRDLNSRRISMVNLPITTTRLTAYR